MTGYIQSSAGIIAGVISLVTYVPYAYDVIRGTARPNRATWLIWALSGGLLFASYSAAAGGAARWVPFSDALGPAIIAVLAIRYGKGGFSWFDVGCLTIAGFSVLGWMLTGSPATALNINVLLAFMGAVPTFRSVYRDPDAEPALVWGAFLLSNSLNLAAVEAWSLSSGLYPVYAVLAAGLVNVLIHRPRSGRLFWWSGAAPAGLCQDRLETRIAPQNL